MICLSLQYGGTALMKSSEKGHMEYVKVLLNGGADVYVVSVVSYDLL